MVLSPTSCSALAQAAHILALQPVAILSPLFVHALYRRGGGGGFGDIRLSKRAAIIQWGYQKVAWSSILHVLELTQVYTICVHTPACVSDFPSFTLFPCGGKLLRLTAIYLHH